MHQNARTVSEFIKTDITPNPFQRSEAFEEEVIDLSEYWFVIKRHRWGILSFAMAALFIGMLVAFSAIPQYKSSVKLLAEPIIQGQGESVGNYEYVNTAWLFYETQYEIIASRAIAEQVINKLDLTNNPSFTGANKKKLFKLPSFDFSIKDLIPDAWRQSDAEIDIGGEPIEVDKLAPYVGLLLGNLKVTGGKESQIITIEYSGSDPVLVSNIVNAVSQAYIEFGLSTRLLTAQQTTGWLTEQLSSLRETLDASEEKLQAYKAEHQLIDTASSQRVATTKLASLTSELIRAQTSLNDMNVAYNQVKRIQREGGNFQAISSVLSSRVIEDLKKEQSKLSRRVSELSERYGEKHPKMIAARSELAEAQRTLRGEIGKIVSNIRRERNIASSQVAQLKQLIAQQEQGIQVKQGGEWELLKLEREVETNRIMYENFLTSTREMESKTDYNVSNVKVVDRAHPAGAPYKPKKKLIMLVAFVLGAFLGILVAFLREHLDNTFKTSEEVEKKLGIPAIGSVPKIAKKELKNCTPERMALAGKTSAFSESINHIRTGVLLSNIDNPPQVIMVTSSIPAEGKTTTSSNLALSLSQMGKTLLLEMDLRKPRLKNYLSGAQHLGLTDYLAGRVSIDEALAADPEATQLSHLVAGTIPPNPLEIVSSQSFEHLITDLRNKFEYIVVDAPPVIAVSDALVVGQLVDAILMVIKADSTSKKLVETTIKRLAQVHLRPIGAILEQQDVTKLSEYGYETAYYHGHYYNTPTS
jgi:capsular exopolysaccharide synthesis family protein